MKSLILSALLVASVPAAAEKAAAPAAKAEPSIDALVAKMQDFYEKTSGFDTRFQQQFTQGGMPSRFAGTGASGRLRFRKPAGDVGPLMRWDYEDGRILLLVKDTSWTFDPDTKQATAYKVDASNLSAAVTFLWGKGRLAEEFDISRATRSDLADGGVPLELLPKKKGQGFEKVFLVVDAETGVVKQSVVVQPNGSENRITFAESRLDAAVNSADFDPEKAFPAGTARIKANLPGQQR